ncbi:MAG: nucleotide exchange factor GrpE [Ruminococcaceae bacterium]|nr:nucleotide exchange factor GrpE [Oscillospiraceae bacterium]
MEDKNITEPITEEETAPECEPEVKEEKEEKKDKKRSDKKIKAELDELKAEMEKKDAALSEADDKYLRLMAEYDNFRRRSREEKDATYSAAVSDTVSELLPLFDNLELASKYTGDNATEAAKGVEMILSSVPAILEKLNVTSFGEVGEKFDPNIHNAVMHVDDENFGENEIIDVFQKGYKHGDRVIRFAMVRVAN